MAIERRRRALIERGYFPSQLPPPFRSSALGPIADELTTAWRPTGKKKAPEAKWELFSVARAGHHRRATAIVNPVPQLLLSDCIATYWAPLVKHFRASRISASHPRFLRASSRAAQIPSMRPLYDKRTLLSAGYKVVLRTDISRFFPTIYTHSIPWALHTKPVAKRNRAGTPTYFGNMLDAALRACQDGQTLGIPIGPDSSHVIAEAIATTVDVAVRATLPGDLVGLRYVDDYFLFFQSTTEAEKALANISRSLREFELQINFDKTEIGSIWSMSDDHWTHELRGAEISWEPVQQRADLNRYFEQLRKLSKDHEDENVAVYGLKRASSVLVRPVNWPLFEAHLCHVAMAHPNCLEFAARVLTTYAGVGYPIDYGRIARLCNQVILDHAGLSHHSEVAWALWICRSLGLRVVADCVEAVSTMHSSVCALILLDLEGRGLLAAPVNLTSWRGQKSVESLWDDLWLLSYEAGVRGWAGFTDRHVRANPYFELLRQKGVRFYDEGRELTPLFTVKYDPADIFAPGQEQVPTVDLLSREDVESMVEFEEEEGGYGSPFEAEEHPEDDDEMPF